MTRLTVPPTVARLPIVLKTLVRFEERREIIETMQHGWAATSGVGKNWEWFAYHKRIVALEATQSTHCLGLSGEIASDEAGSTPATLCCQRRAGPLAFFMLTTRADGDNPIGFGGRRW